MTGSLLLLGSSSPSLQIHFIGQNLIHGGPPSPHPALPALPWTSPLPITLTVQPGCQACSEGDPC